MDPTTLNDTWPSEAQMPAGPGLPDPPLQLWDADGWSHASLVIAAGEPRGEALTPSSRGLSA
jgi:hypothetical protein